jgi:kynurenine formamidase
MGIHARQGWSRRGWLRAVTPLLVVLLQVGPAGAGALERAILGKSVVVDLTHSEGERPSLTDPQRSAATGDGERQGSVPGAKDFGTRLNALGIVRKVRRTIAQIPPRELLAPAIVVDVTAQVTEAPDYRVTVRDLQAWERKNGRIPKQSAVLLYTGWARRWAEGARYANLDAQGVSHVPGFSMAALDFLVNDRQVQGVGLDAFTPDVPSVAGGDAPAPIVPPGVWQIENLANLDRLPIKGAKLIVLPLRLEAASAPTRAIVILP